MKRTIETLRDILSGDVWVYLKDSEICRKFYEEAESEGFRFGDILPTQSPVGRVIAVHEDKSLGHVGCYGHMRFFMCPGTSDADRKLHRIDYAKYNAGEKDFYYVDDARHTVKDEVNMGLNQGFSERQVVI